VVHGAGLDLDYRHPVGMPRVFQIPNIGLVVLAAACVPAAASIAAAPAAHLEAANGLVLRLDDVKSGATVTVDAALTAADTEELLGIPDITTDVLAHNGFANAHVRAFAWKDPSLAVTRALASTTYLFADAAGAHRTLSLFTDAANAAGAGPMSLGTTIGDESAAFQVDSDLTDSFGASISQTTTGVLFRHANALSLVSYRVASADDDPRYVIALARTQLALQKAVAPAGVGIPAAAPPGGVQPFGGTHTLAAGLVLTVADVPAGMRQRNAAPMSVQDFAAGDAAMAAKFVEHGFLSAYGRVFTRNGQFGKDARMIRSGTALLADSAGAHKAFQDFTSLATAVGAHSLGTVDAGDESVAMRLDDYAVDASYVEVIFRHHNALSVIEIEFPARMISRSLSLDLAKRQVTHQLADIGMLKPFR
jgi:hypothetical protein